MKTSEVIEAAKCPAHRGCEEMAGRINRFGNYVIHPGRSHWNSTWAFFKESTGWKARVFCEGRSGDVYAKEIGFCKRKPISSLGTPV
jgi:hypothetical protein